MKEESPFSSTIALTGVAAFASAALATQFLRTDLDWVQAPLSFYLLGAYGSWLRVTYVALGVALIALGIGYYRALTPTARSGAPTLLFCMGGAALAVTAIARSWTPGDPPALEHFIHGLAASTAFLCTTTAMLLQSWRLRGDPAWRHRFAPAFALAAIAFIALWTHALWHDAPRGLTQKVVIALIVLWLGMAGNWLRRSRHCSSADRSALDEARRMKTGSPWA